ncbi:MAG: glycerophosphodiester phosphodiesterase family protein [Nitrospirota bacterium]
MYDTSSGTQPFPEKITESVLKDENTGASKALKTREKKSKERVIEKRTQKELNDMKEIRNFWEETFGKGAVASFFISLNAFLAGEEGTFDAAAFDEEITARAKELSKQGFNMDEFVVAHRSLGYGRHRENSEEGLKAALNGGEKQIEIDLRKGPDGKLYLSHGPIKKNDVKNLLSINKALEIFAESDNQNVAIFFDVKEKGVVKLLDAAMNLVDTSFKGRAGYRSLKDRHFIMAFDKTILREAKNSNGARPLVYYYFPTAKYGIMSGLISLIGRKRVKSMLDTADSIGGTRTAEGLEKTGLSVNGKSVGKKFKTNFDMWRNLPSSDILATIKSSNGYLCIPAALATKELVKKIKGKGIKVAVWGANDSRIKKMIHELGVDLVITDTPRAASKKSARRAA